MCSFDVSWCVPVLESLRFVDVIVILLFVFGFLSIFSGHIFHECIIVGLGGQGECVV